MKRNFMCTINFDQKADPVSVLPDFTIYPGIKRATFQLEKGDKSKRLHWQIFLEFQYPVKVKSITKATAEQGLKMHVDEKVQNKHPKAGRNYVTKGQMIDNHRYAWTKDFGWENNKEPAIKLLPSDKPPTDIIERLKWNIKQCQLYLMEHLDESVVHTKNKII